MDYQEYFRQLFCLSPGIGIGSILGKHQYQYQYLEGHDGQYQYQYQYLESQDGQYQYQYQYLKIQIFNTNTNTNTTPKVNTSIPIPGIAGVCWVRSVFGAYLVHIGCILGYLYTECIFLIRIDVHSVHFHKNSEGCHQLGLSLSLAQLYCLQQPSMPRVAFLSTPSLSLYLYMHF